MYRNIQDSTLGDKKYYLYRHIRLDTNQPFYIGIGTKKEGERDSKIYQRAFVNKKNDYWINVYNKCGRNIEINILYEADTKEEIFNKEIELITLYGRKNIGTGPLVNLTIGGDDKDRMSLMKSRENVGITIFDLNGNFVHNTDSIKEATIFLNLKSPGSIHSVLNGQSFAAKGYIVRRTSSFNSEIPDKIEVDKSVKQRSATMHGRVKIVNNITRDEKIYNNFEEYCKEEGKSRKMIMSYYYRCLYSKKQPRFTPIWLDI